MEDYRVNFSCEKNKNGDWIKIGVDHITIENLNEPPSHEVAIKEAEDVISNFNQSLREGEFPRRVTGIISIEKIVYKFECNECGWKGDNPDWSDDDDSVEICPECESEDLYRK